MHKLHNEYLLTQTHKKLPLDYGVRVKKLVSTLEGKFGYIAHEANLDLYLKLGMKLTEMHRVLSFKQSPCLKSYIDLNTDMSIIAKTKSEKTFMN